MRSAVAHRTTKLTSCGGWGLYSPPAVNHGWSLSYTVTTSGTRAQVTRPALAVFVSSPSCGWRSLANAAWGVRLWRTCGTVARRAGSATRMISSSERTSGENQLHRQRHRAPDRHASASARTGCASAYTRLRTLGRRTRRSGSCGRVPPWWAVTPTLAGVHSVRHRRRNTRLS